MQVGSATAELVVGQDVRPLAPYGIPPSARRVAPSLPFGAPVNVTALNSCDILSGEQMSGQFPWIDLWRRGIMNMHLIFVSGAVRQTGSFATHATRRRLPLWLVAVAV